MCGDTLITYSAICCVLCRLFVHNHLIEAGGMRYPTGLYISPPWFAIYRYVNEQYVISCRIESSGINSTNLMQQKWSFNGDLITEGNDGMQLKVTEINCVSLVFTNIGKHHEGKYSCFVKGSAIPLQKTFELLVTVPIAMKCDAVIETKVETDVFLSCTVTGNPKPYVTWEFNGKNLGNVANGNGTYILKLLKVRVEDAGEYICKAFQSPFQRSDNKEVIKLIVYHAPIFEVKDRLIHIPLNETVVMKNHVRANPPARFIWYKDDNEHAIRPKNNRMNIVNTNQTTSLQVTIYDSSYTGSYKCEACNELGCKTHTMHVKETVKLNKPEIGIWLVDTEWVHFYITTQKEARYFKFQIVYNTYSNVNDIKWLSATEVNVNKTLSSLGKYGLYELGNLYPFTKYVVRVAAVNEFIRSEYSVEKKFVTRIRIGQEDTSLCSRASAIVLSSLSIYGCYCCLLKMLIFRLIY